MGKLVQALKQAKAILSAVKLSQEPLADGSLIQYDTPDIQAGEVVYLCAGADDWSVLPDGKYKTKSQLDFTVQDGKVAEVNKIGEVKTSAPGPVLQLMSDATVYGGKKLKIDGEIVVGSKVSYEDNTIPVNGTYQLTDPAGNIYITDGLITKAELGKSTDQNSTPGTGAVDLKTEMDIVNQPGAGAPEDLLHPNQEPDPYATCMSKMAEIHAQHSVFQSHHDALRKEHDGLISKVTKLQEDIESLKSEKEKMSQTITTLESEKVKMSETIKVLEKTPAAFAIEEEKGMKQTDPKIKGSRAYQILNA